MPAVAPLLRRLGEVEGPSPWTAAALIAFCHGLYILAAGVRMAPDSQNYALWSARLIESGFDYPTIFAQLNGGFPPILYALFGTLLALLRLGFGEYWAIALVLLNFATHVAVGLLILRLISRLTDSAAAGWGALLLYLGCFDLLMWVPFVLSDATFVFLAFAVFALAASRVLGDPGGWARVLVPALAGIFYRPTGMVLIPDLAWAVYLSKAGRTVRRRVLPAALGVVAIVLAPAFAWFVQDPARWPLDSLSVSFRVTAAQYAVGEVVSARLETYHAPPVGLGDYLLISADRLLHFFAIGAADFSAAHWAGELAFFLPTYALAAWLAVALWRGRTAFEASQRKVFIAAFGAVMSYAVFHALVQVDFDWRYRIPILPHLILLAAGGLADLARRARAAR